MRFLFLFFITLNAYSGWMDDIQKNVESVATDVSNSTSEVASDLSRVAGQVVDETSIVISDFSDEAMNKLKKEIRNLLFKIKEYTDEANRIGFYGSEVWVTGTLPPTASISFEDRGKTGLEEQVLEDNKDNISMLAILEILINVREYKVSGYSLNKVVIKINPLGFPVPQVRLDVIND